MRRLSWSLTAFSLARIRFEIVIRLTQNRPLFDLAQMCVKPRKSNVSGLPSPRPARSRAANRPNSISRVLPGCSSSPNFANRPRIQRLVRVAPRPEPVGKAQEVRLIDGVEHLDDGPLDDLVLQRGDAERP